MPANDPAKTSALLQAADKELAKANQALERTEAELADWLKDMDRVDKRAAEAAAAFTKIADHLRDGRQSVDAIRTSLMVARAKRFRSDQLLDNLQRKVADAGNAVLELRKNVAKKEQAAAAQKDDKKAQMELELARKALEKADTALTRLVMETTGVFPVSELQAVVKSLEQGKKEMRKYAAVVDQLAGFAFENQSLLQGLLENVEKALDDADKWSGR